MGGQGDVRRTKNLSAEVFSDHCKYPQENVFVEHMTIATCIGMNKSC